MGGAAIQGVFKKRLEASISKDSCPDEGGGGWGGVKAGDEDLPKTNSKAKGHAAGGQAS